MYINGPRSTIIGKSLAKLSTSLAIADHDTLMMYGGFTLLALGAIVSIPFILEYSNNIQVFTTSLIPIAIMTSISFIAFVPKISGYKDYLALHLTNKDDTEYRTKGIDVMYPLYFSILTAVSITGINYGIFFFVLKPYIDPNIVLGVGFAVGMAIGGIIFLLGGSRGATRIEELNTNQEGYKYGEGIVNHLDEKGWEYNENAKLKQEDEIPLRGRSQIGRLMMIFVFALLSGATTSLGIWLHDFLLETLQTDYLAHVLSINGIFIPLIVIAPLVLRGIEKLGRLNKELDNYISSPDLAH